MTMHVVDTLPRARNAGIAVAQSLILGFPDDDCWYRPEFLELLWGRFSSDPRTMGWTGLCIDETGHLAAGGGSLKPQVITKATVWGLGVSAAIFLRRSVFDAVGGFDEGLGLGASSVFQSGEETDLMLRIIAAGFCLRYDPALIVLHPSPDLAHPRAAEKARGYGLGMGRVLRLHDFSRFAAMKHVVRPMVGALFAFSTNRRSLARVRWQRARGRLQGWRSDVKCDRPLCNARLDINAGAPPLRGVPIDFANHHGSGSASPQS